MKKVLTVTLVLVQILSLNAQTKNLLRLWYDQPASCFEEALPLGNGRIGLMIYGGVENEVINLNEETLWGGGPTDNSAPAGTRESLAKVRELLFEGKWTEASRELRNIQGPNGQAYVPMGDLLIQQDVEGEVKNYSRDLDLKTAIATTVFEIGDVTYIREAFVSAPAQVAVVKLTASKPEALNFSVNTRTPFENAVIRSLGNDEFSLSGQLPAQINTEERFPLVYEQENGQRGMKYQYRVKAVAKDGIITTEPGLRISGASEVILYISAATSFNNFLERPDISGKDEDQLAVNYLSAALKSGYDKIKKDYIKDYQDLFNRVSFDLGSNNQADLPTDRRLREYKEGAEDPALEALYFQFGRYLLISSSRPGGVPANLQGIWNNRQRPPWGSNYTVNINLQMNYWPAEMCNLSELVEPLITQICNMAINGREVVKNYYGMQGWTTHHNSDIWAHAAPVGHREGDPKWANWSLGSPWHCQHLYEHYRFTQDKEFLSNVAYTLMKDAALFCDDWLVEKDGHLVTAPSTSPENVFIDENGNKGVVTIASAMDLEIIWDLYTNLIEASEILGVDEALRKEWYANRERLFPLRIGTKGNLMEWYGDWEDEDPHHRHVSHLFGLHPGRQISPLTTPELADACVKTLEIRGDGGTGWSKAWKINFWARLLREDKAYLLYRELLSSSTLPNLFDTHPPFQIDGNFGGASGVGEMLLQSHLDEIHLLPALPASWQKGEIKGMKARGGFQVSMAWTKRKISTLTLVSEAGNPCKIRSVTPLVFKGVTASSEKEGDYYVYSFETKKGRSYVITGK